MPELPDELSAYAPFITRLQTGEALSDNAHVLVEHALSAWLRPGFEEFVCVSRLHFEPFAYQLSAAKRVLTRLRGRAILADEVGLGKTIEACLVLSELFLRRLIARTLILVPPGLVEQWCEELAAKFALPVLALGSEAWERSLHPWQAPIIVASLATARRAPWQATIGAIDWDLVIADEAHRLKNPKSASATLVKSLRTRRLLLLTATPVENRLDDLFSLVNLVRPGLLGTPKDFRKSYGAAATSGATAKLEPLQKRMADVMVRHRRSEVALMLPRRLAETLRVPPAAEEAELYALLSARVRESGRAASSAQLFGLRNLQRMAGSSPRAALASLQRAGWHDLADRARGIASSKAAILVQLLERYRTSGEKVVVFTAFRETLALLAEVAREAAVPAAIYHGSLTRHEKIETMNAFRDAAPLLLTTEAAGEGRNLQFCHVMINFDLPWNPMQIEQRLGRIHRIGQDHDVVLTNLVGTGTLEERILRVLESKINLFELVVGELDMILGRIDDDFDFEAFVFASHVASRDDAEFDERVATLGDDLARARQEYVESRGMTDRLVAGASG
ncbi:MAG: DEAD/DEAH box helicase [Candidatus Eremiobacteraeota bacterium]|nr:DEAD/DEAH box helicase [Candidatus Eremiobacteraeota bacterium]MBC5822355.1 DEAD/DEAH box helicase [Candidatus Eremiobacteraeota bacterium]